jgi:hypothetical protein
MRSANSSLKQLAATAALVGLSACAPTSLIDVNPSSTLVDPSTVQSASGAAQLYNFAVNTFVYRLGGTGNLPAGPNNYIVATALFTDELMGAESDNPVLVGIDERTGGEAGEWADYGLLYNNLHLPRVQLGIAREALRKYAPGSAIRQGEAQALEAFTVIYFAELFCSGIPLTRVSLDKPAAPTPGFTTQELLERAIAMFDSSIALSAGSARIVNLAKIGKGRALLNLGRFAEAANAVNGVPTDFSYMAEFDPAAGFGEPANELGSFVGIVGAGFTRAQVVDKEGGNGLVWSTDPRTGVMKSPSQFGAMLLAAKYSKTAGALQTDVRILDNPIRVGDGLEARLIDAEAALSRNDPSWLGTLNTLRATCVDAATCAPVPGIAPSSLPALSDPGNAASRLDLIMRERAMWLYLTGHRQGDLRRLAKIYGRPRGTLWPTGTYINPGFPPSIAPASTHGTQYGSDVVFTPHINERFSNPLYTGCFNLDP